MCAGYPDQFANYINYCRKLSFEEQPNYLYLRRQFRDLYTRCNFKFDHILDWTIQKYNAIEEANN